MSFKAGMKLSYRPIMVDQWDPRGVLQLDYGPGGPRPFGFGTAEVRWMVLSPDYSGCQDFLMDLPVDTQSWDPVAVNLPDIRLAIMKMRNLRFVAQNAIRKEKEAVKVLTTLGEQLRQLSIEKCDLPQSTEDVVTRDWIRLAPEVVCTSDIHYQLRVMRACGLVAGVNSRRKKKNKMKPAAPPEVKLIEKIARKEIRTAMQVAHEAKFVDTFTALVSIPIAGTITKITPPAQGNAQSQRVADEIRMLVLIFKVDVQLVAQAVAVYTKLRVIVFQWHPSDTGGAPTIANILRTAGTSHLSEAEYYLPDVPNRKILYDHVYCPIGTTTTPSGKDCHVFDVLHLKRFNHSIVFDPGAQTGVQQFYFILVADVVNTISVATWTTIEYVDA